LKYVPFYRKTFEKNLAKKRQFKKSKKRKTGFKIIVLGGCVQSEHKVYK
jgi:hypothetical protein